MTWTQYAIARASTQTNDPGLKLWVERYRSQEAVFPPSPSTPPLPQTTVGESSCAPAPKPERAPSRRFEWPSALTLQEQRIVEENERMSAIEGRRERQMVAAAEEEALRNREARRRERLQEPDPRQEVLAFANGATS